MTIRVSQDIEDSINAAVQSGRFPSVDAAMDEAARLLLRQLEQEQREKKGEEAVTRAPDSILEMIDERRKRVPPEEFAKLPKDGAAQLDHYVYGSPKRPVAE